MTTHKIGIDLQNLALSIAWKIPSDPPKSIDSCPIKYDQHKHLCIKYRDKTDSGGKPLDYHPEQNPALVIFSKGEFKT